MFGCIFLDREFKKKSLKLREKEIKDKRQKKQKYVNCFRIVHETLTLNIQDVRNYNEFKGPKPS